MARARRHRGSQGGALACLLQQPCLVSASCPPRSLTARGPRRWARRRCGTGWQEVALHWGRVCSPRSGRRRRKQKAPDKRFNRPDARSGGLMAVLAHCKRCRHREMGSGGVWRGPLTGWGVPGGAPRGGRLEMQQEGRSLGPGRGRR